MILEDLAVYLEEETELDLIATGNLFIGELPVKKVNCVSMVYVPSEPPNSALDVFYQQIDFWSRYQNADDSYNMLKDIQTELHQKVSWDLDNWHIYLAHSVSGIEDFGRDNERNKLHKLTMRFIFRPIAGDFS